MPSFFKAADPDRLFQQVFQRSIVKRITLNSQVLGVRKAFNIYFPVGYENLSRRFPVLYLFRNHEDEWINRHQDASRKGNNIKDVLDGMIRDHEISPMVVVMPGLGSDDNTIPGLGINFEFPQFARSLEGIGTGLFEDYLVQELIPYVDTRFRTLGSPLFRSTDGFSIGGYTAVMLALRHPELFTAAGSFDGTHMWLDFRDPRSADGTDKVWIQNPMFIPALGKPANLNHAAGYNPSNLLHAIAEDQLPRPDLAFFISCVNREPDGNRDRCLHLLDMLNLAGYENGLHSWMLDSRAEHTWYWADRHMEKTLVLHDARFRKNAGKV